MNETSKKCSEENPMQLVNCQNGSNNKQDFGLQDEGCLNKKSKETYYDERYRKVDSGTEISI